MIFRHKIQQQLFTGLIALLLPALFASAQNFKLPPYEKFKLKNGLTIYLMPQREVPVINVSVILPAGAIYDGEKSGLASLTAEALKLGTSAYTKEKLDEAIDFIGATVNTYASKESAGLSARFATKDQDQVLGIIQQILLHPSFDTAEFNKEKRRTLVGLEQQKESPGSVINSYFDRFLYGDHVYGNIIQGKIATVSPLTAADARKFYQDNYTPDGAAICVAGDFDKMAMKNVLTKLFATWTRSGKASPNLASKPINPPTTNRVLLVNKEDAKETTFYIGGPGIARNNPDLVAIDVINTLFGGRFTSMLNDELRVNTGLTYGARSRFSTLKNGGSFFISTFTANKTTEPAIDKALEVLKKLHTDGITDQQLASAKNYVKGQFPPRYETAGQLADLMTQMFWYNFDESYINNFEKNVDGLTLDKAKSIIAKYFPENKLQFVLIGKAAEIKKIAEKYGPVTEVSIKEETKKGF